MAVRPILRFPDPRLHTVARPVEQFDDALRELVQDMVDTMIEAPGIGLAATQIDVHLRVIVIDVSEERNALRVFVNPEIVGASPECKVYEEGCLSVPGVYEEVQRPDRVTVRAFDEYGKVFTLEADGLLAVCLQHEMDHLEGRVFVQHLSRLKQNRIRTRMLKDRATA